MTFRLWRCFVFCPQKVSKPQYTETYHKTSENYVIYNLNKNSGLQSDIYLSVKGRTQMTRRRRNMKPRMAAVMRKLRPG